MVRAYESDAKLVMLGVTYESSTYIHLVEVLCWHRRLESDPCDRYAWISRMALGAFWEENGKLSRGRVGDAKGRLFSIRTYVDTLVAEVERTPGAYFK